jgi:hypothetical protein
LEESWKEVGRKSEGYLDDLLSGFRFLLARAGRARRQTTPACTNRTVAMHLSEMRLALRYLRRYNRSWWPGLAAFIIYEPEMKHETNSRDHRDGRRERPQDMYLS